LAVSGAMHRRRHATRLLFVAGLCSVVGLVLAGNANATHLDPGHAFYWQLPSVHVRASAPRYDAGAIAVSPDGNLVYVADTTGDEVDEFTSDGVLVHIARLPQYQEPSGVTTDLSGNVYVVYQAQGEVIKFTANLVHVGAWSVFGAHSIAADRAGHIWVLTNFLNAVGEFDSSGKSIGGFVANLPGQFFPEIGNLDPRYFPQIGYDAPYKTVADAITVDKSGDPVVVGASYQGESQQEPNCSYVIDGPTHLDYHPYQDPLVSGETVRYTPSGAPVAYGWLSESARDCNNGWTSDRTNPDGVAVDPNGGNVYATSNYADTGNDLGAVHLDPSLSNTNQDLNAYGPPCYSTTCSGPIRDWELMASNSPQGVAFDCRSDLYMLWDNGNARYVAKFINSDYVQPASCSPLLQRASLLPGITVFPRVQTKGGGKASVVLGCQARVCVGTVRLLSKSASCRGCAASLPLHFRILPGLQTALSLRLSRLGRLLLARHPGLRIHIVVKLKGGKTSVESQQLREPAALTARCLIPGAVDGAASVSGTLTPSHGHERISVEYVLMGAPGVLLPAVQRTVITDSAGRFVDHYALDAAGRWTVLVSWGGDSTRQPTAALPCSGTVQKATTHLTLTCPQMAAIGTHSPFSGALSGGPADALLAILYENPSGGITADEVTTGSQGDFTDSFSPSRSGGWQAIAHYDGNSDHAAAEAVCPFTVQQPAPNDFSISVTPSADSVAQGAAANATINTAVTSGTAQTVSLSTSGASPGSISVSPSSVTAGGSASLSVQTTATTAPGTYMITVTVTGTGTSATHSTTYTLTVTSASSLTLSCMADPNRRYISCSGQLTSGGSGLGGAPIALTYQPPSGPSTTDIATTSATGAYSDQLNAPAGSLLASGTWSVQAQYTGDSSHAPASNTQNLTVP
jgi:hypothetical protein